MALGAPALAAPRVALLTAGMSATDVELARAGLESTGVDVRVVAATDLPLVGAPAEWAKVRVDAEAALQRAHAAFVATRFDEARAIDADVEARLRRWAGEPKVAQALAELALVAALSGDEAAMTRAVGYAPALTLDAGYWNPDVRRRWQSARARLDLEPRVAVTFMSQPADARVFVDGIEVGHTPLQVSLTPKRHTIEIVHPGFAVAAEAVVIDGAPLTRVLTPLANDERLGALRLALQAGEAAGPDDLIFAAFRFDADAAMAPVGTPPHAMLAGPHVPATTLATGPPREVAAAAGRLLQSHCSIAYTPPERTRAATALALRVATGACVVAVHGAFHVEGGRAHERAAPAHEGHALIELEPADLPSSARPYSLQYRLWGETFVGHSTESLGSEAAPLRVLVDADRTARAPRRWYHKWWIWTIAGGALTAAAVITAVAVYRPPSEARLVGP
jgi:hypothetical protein